MFVTTAPRFISLRQAPQDASPRPSASPVNAAASTLQREGIDWTPGSPQNLEQFIEKESQIYYAAKQQQLEEDSTSFLPYRHF
jgi:hypothetical protein